IGPGLARSIVQFRDEHGAFQNRQDLKRVAGFGEKTFEQAAGFLRVAGSDHPLDNSAVHPERYGVVEEIARDLKCSIGDMLGKRDLISLIPWEKYVRDDLGLPTLRDIEQELLKPGRDPREDGARLLFSDHVADIEDLEVGMKLKG